MVAANRFEALGSCVMHFGVKKLRKQIVVEEKP